MIWCQLTKVLHIIKDLKLLEIYGPFSSANGPDKMSLDALKVIRAVMKEMTHGLTRMMPRGQSVKVLVGGHMG